MRRTLLLDANLLLLLFVGRWNPARFSEFDKLEQFKREDLKLLLEIVGEFEELVTTTHILVEISNLAGRHKEPERSEVFASFAERISLLREHYTPAKLIVADPVFVRLGLTDAAIARIARRQRLGVVTTDGKLAKHLNDIGVEAQNFNHRRSQRLLRLD